VKTIPSTLLSFPINMAYMRAKIEKAVKELSSNGRNNFADNYLKDEGTLRLSRRAFLTIGVNTASGVVT
jgi:hypothetical protein